MEFLTETVKVFVEKTVGYTIAAVGRQMGYLRYKKNVDNLNNKFDDLKGARDGVQRKVQAASYNVEEIEANVQRWQTRVQGITAEVEEFFEKEGQAKLKCFNLKARYQIGKKAHKMGLAVKELKDEADTFHTVGHRVPIDGGTTISTKGYEDFESRKSIFDGVMKALKDDTIPAIGVCGMGGLGKTMLVGKIATQAMKDKLFERIVTVVVSQTPNLKQIQKEIAKELQLKFKDEDTDFQQAHLLRERLKKEKILLIVDDIWNKIDLDALGISLGDDRKGSKLLLTSRFRDVLVNDMDAEKIFQVEVLSNEEAKFLFVKIVGDFAETLNFQSTMVEVVKECAGLPIAITTVANTLKNKKNPNVWKDALQQLKRANPTQIKGMHEKVYLSIKFSYNFLSKEAQSLFLFCSSFKEDMVIQIDLLWRYLVGLDFLEDVYKMEEVRNRVHTLVEILKDSCLLLEGKWSGTFKMHDVIRDVAIHIADKEKKMLTIRSSDDSEKLSNMKKMKDSIGIALFEAKFSELPQRLECPQLNFIILGDKENSLQIPNHIFEGAKNLKVLVLMRLSLPLPSSLSLLQNLQTLALVECDSEDLALIGELKNLKALVLVDSKIENLPIGIRQLTHLQLLDLRRCTELEAIPSNVLSNLKNLEEIHMNQSFNQWQVGGEITERSNARVSELDHLLHLTTLCIHIPNPNILPNALLFDKLVRYEILIGPDWYWNSNSRVEFEISRTLKIDLDRSLQEEDGIKILLKGCEHLTLAPGKGIKNILSEVDKEGFPRLKHLYVQNSVEIQYIIDSICVAFPVLELLSLVNMINLENICHNQLAMGSFHNLRKLEIRKCDNLVFVFSSTLLRCFSQLQEIEIEDCKVISAIVAEERKHGIQVNDDIITDTIDFPQLRSLNLKRLPNLMGFCSNVDSQSLFNKKVAFSNLEDICISDKDNLKMLWHNYQLVPDSFCKLKNLGVARCKNLMNIFPPNMLRRLQNLENLEIRDCNSVEEVLDIRGENVDEICDTVSNKLKVLTLFNLPKLKHVWSLNVQAILTFQNLHNIKVSNCKSLKSLFPVSVAKSLEQLRYLEIHDCGLEEIVAMKEGLEIVTKFVFPQLFHLNLDSLPELKCFYPGKHTSEWPSLKYLYISKCDKVKTFASNELSFSDTNELGHHVQVQQPLFLFEKAAFPNLEVIHINDMDNLKMLWHNHQLVPDSFCKLKSLFVGGCKNLINIFPPNMLRRLQNLEDLYIRNCNSVEEVFEIKGAIVDEICDMVSTRLRVLCLSNLPKLKHVWSLDLQAILTFQNLHKVKVSNCKSMKNLFPASVAKSLKQLKKLNIHDCGLEEIVALEEGVETAIKFVFPRITSLDLESLPELKYFYPGKHILEWPSLKRLRIKNCDKVKIIASNELSFQERDELGHHVQIQQPLFPIEKDTLSNFEELKLNWDDTIYQTYDRLKAQLSCKLKVLGLYGKDRSTAFPWLFVHGLYNVKELDISNFFLEEICPCGIVDNEGQYAEMFERLTTLHLSKMPKLMHLWKENSQQGRGIQNLESLHVSYCGRLKNLVPSSMCFRNLYTLEVSECHGLISLATSSTVKSLVQLKALTLSGCKRMREIVTNEGEGEAGDEICFNQLTDLSLNDLPTLGSFFHLGNRTMKFPSLEFLYVFGCPELKIFSNGVLSMQKLSHVRLDGNIWWKYQEGLFPVEDVNTFIKRCWEKNNDPCLRQLFTQKTNASTSEAGEENDVDDLEDDSM
ncbi:probable disease resistance protein At4g27220 isoform X5 [Quercus robur]|uniref:probable disease resistance protein At4g27220 isoform X5 n=1 Tax=Quercus robur TaxID=38942 RepID=UPI002161134B|nr:probable disease resistance protein At4g27220 isoform X5 [Quercus robur]